MVRNLKTERENAVKLVHEAYHALNDSAAESRAQSCVPQMLTDTRNGEEEPCSVDC